MTARDAKHRELFLSLPGVISKLEDEDPTGIAGGDADVQNAIMALKVLAGNNPEMIDIPPSV